MRPRLGSLALALPLTLQACLLDFAPARRPLDEAWTARMLAGDYGQWFSGEKSAHPKRGDRMSPSPRGASDTRYGIDVFEHSALGGGGWSIVGGMVARVVRPEATVELFGKEVVRVHGPTGVATDEDYSYEFFLVVRPTATARGRLIRQWRFPRPELVLREHGHRPPGFAVEGFLAFDERSRIATVTVTGLVRPFQERVDLSRELP